ncbi:MAG TPA: hypothetical protein VMB71_03845 [Acetobacteraceae bacterium]|nr:hypothetical protein [Acetobacteraceae bacterium]
MPTAKKARPNREAAVTDAATPPEDARHQVVPAGGALVTGSFVLQNETARPIDIKFLGKSEVKLPGKRARKK